MTFPIYQVERCLGKAKEKEILECEEKINIRFPKLFRSLVEECDGGIPTKNNFNYYSTTFKRIEGISLGMFLMFSEAYPDKNEHLLDRYLKRPSFFPQGLVAFAEVGNGDQICFDYRQGKDNPDPPIVIWEHEGEEENDVSYLAPNFEAFMNMLMDEEEAEKDFKRLVQESTKEK